ncbi:MAG: ATP-binding cassette domain-containing protein, partial [bacterium]|nr:ATP-binding cassette domain-containing protein [bacterium]
MNATATAPVTTTGEVFLEVRGLVKDYPGVRAADRVSLAIRSGEVVGLVGKNGAGKSTVIKILAGATAPDEGRILLDGTEVELHNPHDATLRGLSFVHQELSVVPELSVAE